MRVLEKTHPAHLAPCTDLTKAAQERLRNSPYPPVRSVCCEERDGVLFLRGRLPSFFYKQVAQETVAGIEGLLEIVNAIEVT